MDHTHNFFYTSQKACKNKQKADTFSKKPLTLKMKNEAYRTMKFKMGYINKIICYSYQKKNTSTGCFFLLASEYYDIILPV